MTARKQKQEDGEQPQRVSLDVVKMPDIKGCGTEEETKIDSGIDIKREVLDNQDREVVN